MYTRRHCSSGKASGFTMVELMVTIAVLAILLAVAGPNFSDMLLRNRLSSGANDLLAALQLARSEAIRTNTSVEVCPSIDGNTCNGSDWTRVAVRQVGAAVSLRDVQLTSAGLSTSASERITASNPNRIWFRPDGFMRAGTIENPTSAAVSLCAERLSGDNARDVRIAVSRISVVQRAATDECVAPAD